MSSKRTSFEFIDLFAGIGGMRLALEAIGGKCVFSSEWNKFAAQTYESNFGEKPNGDIRKINPDEIPDHDVLVAGFPCQPFSLAGVSKKRSLHISDGFDDKNQGTLFFHITKIIRAKKPFAFLLENVKNLKSHNNGKTFERIVNSLKNLDYDVYSKVVDAQAIVPQHRERIFIIGFNEKRDFKFPHIQTMHPKLEDILEKKVLDKYTLTNGVWNALQRHAENSKKKGNGFGYGIAKNNGITRTLSARYYKDGAEILLEQKNKNPRRLTPKECARLMGFPDDFIIHKSDNQAYRQFGNSVVPKIVEILAKEIIHHKTKN